MRAEIGLFLFFRGSIASCGNGLLLETKAETNMKTSRCLLCIFTCVLISTLSARATPYASGVTNQGGTIQYILNEVPDSAWVIFEDGTSNSIAAPVVGTNTFSLGSHTSFGIYVKKAGNGTPSQISDDSATYANWNTPRGVTANANAANGYSFGRVYVNNSLGGSVLGKGIYGLNADLSILLGGTNGDLGDTWTNAGSSSSPYRMHVGADDNVYLGDFTAANANIYQAAPDLSSVSEVFGEQGEAAGIAAGVHGRSFGQPIVLGSIATSNMVLWVADASLPIGATTTLGFNAGIGNVNNIDRYTIGAGPLPWTNAPDLAMNLGINSIADLDDDVDVGPISGNIFGMNYRANYGMPCLQIYDPTGMNLLWSSLEGPINVGPDFFNFDFDGSQFSIFAIAVSPDERFLAAGLINNPLLVLDLTNGIPDTSSLLIISNAPNTSGYEDLRSICWDAADNLYTISSGQGLLRVFSLGLPATCVTSNDVTSTNGTFQLVLPSIKASVVATAPLASQNFGTPTPGVFTITLNTNFLSSAITVNFVLGGTATNGTYVASATNSVTFPAGTSPSGNWSQTVTITPTATPNIGPTLTVTLSINGGVTYLATSPVEDTVAIANTGPQFFSVTSVSAGTLYRGLSNDFGEFVITRLGDTNVGPVTLTNFTYSGTATFGVDYRAGAQLEVGSYPAIGSPGVVFNAGEVSKTVIVGAPVPTPYGSPAVGDESINVGLGSTNGSLLSQEGISYTVNSATAALTLLDNAYPPEFVLWSNPLTNASDSVNWTLTFAGTNLGLTTVPPVVIPSYPNNESGAPSYPSDDGGTNDFDVEFGYGVATDGVGQSLAMASKGWTNALKMTVNKDQNFIGASMGVNVYPTGKIFGGNYALRFSMNLIEGTGYTGTTLSEAAEFGLNHAGTNCNWVSGDLVVGPPQIGSGYTNIDGVWITIDSAAGIATGGTPPDFGLYTGGTSALQGLPNTNWYQPVSDPGTALATVYKHPTPYNATGSGTPASILPTGVWSDVELKQFNGTVTLSINKTPVLTYAVTNQFTNGDIMLGYDDPFANPGVGSGAAVYYSDARVVELAPYVTITPALLTVYLEQPATFTATATGAEPFTNVWYFGATPISTNVVNSAVDSNSLVIASASSANAGNYSVVVSDLSGGSVTSSVVTLAVTVAPPSFTTLSLNTAGTEATLNFTTGNPFDTTNSFTLQSTTNLANTPNSGFTNVTGTVFTLTGGVFSAQTPTSGPATYYRLLHN